MQLKASPWLIAVFLLAACFTLATTLQVREPQEDSNGGESGNFFKLLLGNGRQLLANQFYIMADVYFHSGYYPSVFDKQEGQSDVLAAVHGRSDDEEDSTNVDFFGAPKDWIDRFGWRFRLNHHTHLENGNQREILPWLQLAADLNPRMIDTYTVAAYWLRTGLHDPKQAESFLREGLRNNPDSYEILFELGRLYHDSYHDNDRARNVWELALKRWLQQPPEKQKENRLGFEEITVNLANLERESGNYAQSINWFEAAQKVSPNPMALQKQIDELKEKMAAATNAPAPPPH